MNAFFKEKGIKSMPYVEIFVGTECVETEVVPPRALERLEQSIGAAVAQLRVAATPRGQQRQLVLLRQLLRAQREAFNGPSNGTRSVTADRRSALGQFLSASRWHSSAAAFERHRGPPGSGGGNKQWSATPRRGAPLRGATGGRRKGSKISMSLASANGGVRRRPAATALVAAALGTCQGAATAAASSATPSPRPAPCGIMALATGFTLPTAQYQSYADQARVLGLAPLLFSDGSSSTQPTSLADASSALLSHIDDEARRLALPAATPLVLVGHSRGAKTAILTAAASRRPVAALVLIDPVDGTSFEPASVLDRLEAGGAKVPTAVIGAGLGGDCAPAGSNYAAVFGALERAGTPRLLALVRNGGHLQFLDRRQELLSDVCTFKKGADVRTRGVAQTVLCAWCAAFVPGAAMELGEGESLQVAREVMTARAAGASSSSKAAVQPLLDWLERASLQAEVKTESGGFV